MSPNTHGISHQRGAVTIIALDQLWKTDRSVELLRLDHTVYNNAEPRFAYPAGCSFVDEISWYRVSPPPSYALSRWLVKHRDHSLAFTAPNNTLHLSLAKEDTLAADQLRGSRRRKLERQQPGADAVMLNAKIN